MARSITTQDARMIALDILADAEKRRTAFAGVDNEDWDWQDVACCKGITLMERKGNIGWNVYATLDVELVIDAEWTRLAGESSNRWLKENPF